MARFTRLLLGGTGAAALVGAASSSLGGSRFVSLQAAGSGAVSMSATAVSNPLLDTHFFPRFADVRAEHVEPAIASALEDAVARLARLEAQVEAELGAGRTPGYGLLADGLELLDEAYSAPWRTVCHLKATKDSDELRAAHAAVEPKVVEFSNQLGQSKQIYLGWGKLKGDAEAWAALTPAQQRVVEKQILGAELTGVGLEGDSKARFNVIEQELAALSTKFNNNLMDSLKAFSLRLDTPEQVAGLPPSAKATLAANARARDDKEASADKGPWVVTLDAPSLLSVLRFADDAVLREHVYRAYITRASEFANDVPVDARTAQDNAPLISQVLALRAERAGLLGRRSHAEVSVATKMATVASARGLMEQLREKSFEPARAEHTALEAFAGRELKQWDVAYFAEKLKTQRYDFDEEAVRQYLPLESVMAGLFALVEKLFDVEVAEVKPEQLGAQTWDPSVRLLEVRRDGVPAAYIFLDPYSRAAEKRGGAWMSQVRQRSRGLSTDGGVTPCLPVAHMVTNQGPPTVGDDGVEVPSLMSFSECRTLFHECGHALQHVLTTVDEGHVSGIAGVEWDAVEQPSQWMENWLSQPSVLKNMAKHWRTGEAMPVELINKIRAADTFRAASQMVRQIKLSLTDIELHDGFMPSAEKSIFDVEREVDAKAQIMMPLAEDRFLCSFRHIFAGGYSAGYYSYKWAEVLSADGFGAFEEAGLDDDDAVRALGKKYAETVMGMGGSRPATEVFKAFRGRDPNVDALLRHNDLLPAQPVAAVAAA